MICGQLKLEILARERVTKTMTDNGREMSSELWPKAILAASSTLQQAIRCLNESSFQIALVVLPDGVLQGTLTDGDIRRGLLRGLSLDNPIASLVNHDPIVVPPQLGWEIALQLMRVNRIHQLPVVDENRRVVGLHLLDELMAPRQRENLMIIMAGGQGNRLRPHTENCPKPLLPVGDKPMLEHIIELARAEGFGRFVLAIHYLGHMIEEHFGDGSRWQVQISYLRESSPLGTAGALGLLNPRPELPFVVTNGDVITDIRYGELLDFHIRHEATATMAVRVYEWQHPFGVVQTQGVEIVGFEEKPVARSHINAGVYALDPEALRVLSGDAHCDMPTLFERLREEAKRTVAYPMHEPWLDVGRPDDLNRAIAESAKDRKVS
jgi:dTDP-glucose pyrophosphorylase/CBS domain-containing protein